MDWSTALCTPSRAKSSVPALRPCCEAAAHVSHSQIPVGNLSFLRGSSNSESEDLSTGKTRGFRFGARSATATAAGTVSAFNVGGPSFGGVGPSYIQGLGISQREERMVSFQGVGGKGEEDLRWCPRSPVNGEQVELEVWGRKI